MSKYSKHAFGNLENVDSAIESGKVNSYDILCVTDCHDNHYMGWIDKDGNKVIVDHKQELNHMKRYFDRFRKVYGNNIYCIDPVDDYCNIRTENGFGALEEGMLKNSSKIAEILDWIEHATTNKVDNIYYNQKSRQLQLVARNRLIGNKITLNEEIDSSGVPIFDLNMAMENLNEELENDSVIEF